MYIYIDIYTYSRGKLKIYKLSKHNSTQNIQNPMLAKTNFHLSLKKVVSLKCLLYSEKYY